MIIANVDHNNELGLDERWGSDAEPERAEYRGTLRGEFTTTITNCTREGMESYHEDN